MIRFNVWPIVSLFLAGIGISGGLFLFALHAGSIDGIGLTTALARQHAEVEASAPLGQRLAHTARGSAANGEKARGLATNGDFQTYAASAHDASRPVLLALPGEPALEAVTAE
ncbi:hypothetical protein Rvan_3075 [Rhodomicrobium vannielii ATCC 17100]|jgi:hypothetical protein|uniref:Uncharacterized protein n=1 Tax=Rhodomicrobium vannielii (strain ATCC 17100 / DSM 162 / LMG 4299 / NCIMB 10020 / ATH 3.1.1) TaxID=648757 RepID=E3I0G0_RHOVT|nr:hypothetical protein [Rhodomicrobium vannielii]ADP72278.1 hypothetical protein Rvan_3075 [Rhodomicrobium vannielii ATCC 17100]